MGVCSAAFFGSVLLSVVCVCACVHLVHELWKISRNVCVCGCVCVGVSNGGGGGSCEARPAAARLDPLAPYHASNKRPSTFVVGRQGSVLKRPQYFSCQKKKCEQKY